MELDDWLGRLRAFMAGTASREQVLRWLTTGLESTPGVNMCEVQELYLGPIRFGDLDQESMSLVNVDSCINLRGIAACDRRESLVTLPRLSSTTHHTLVVCAVRCRFTVKEMLRYR